MAQFVVNVTLIAALLVLLVVWAVSASRRRRRARREHAQERLLILNAFIVTAGATPTTGVDDNDAEQHHRAVGPSRTGGARRRIADTRPGAAQQLDAASIAALLDLLDERRRPDRRGAIAGLFTSPRTVWSAGARAGQHIGRYTMGERPATGQPEGADLYREAAGELVDIHAHDPADARTQYTRYAAAIGDPALAELYVRSAAFGTYADHDQVTQIVNEITRPAHGPELSDDTATIDT